MKTLKKDNISYIDTEEDFSKTPLLILHGWKQNKESWIDIINILKKSHRIICIDLPGFGESINKEFLNFTVEDYSNSIETFLKDIGIKKVIILSHSFGGRIAINMTIRNKISISKLILFSSAGIINKNNNINYSLLKRIVPESIKNRIRSRDYKESGELKNIFLNAINFNIEPLLKDIFIPTLIIWGDEDKELGLDNAYIINKEIKESELKIMKGNTHFAHMENPYLFTGYINRFLEK